MWNELRQLYNNGSLSYDGVIKAVSEGWLTETDAVGILGEENEIEVWRSIKLKEISNACNAAITSGVDVTIDEDTLHFNLSTEDQANISNLFRIVELGGTEFPYQSDGGVCQVFTSTQIAQIYMAAQTAITTQTTYHNQLKAYVNSLESVDDIEAVSYGMELPDEYAEVVSEKLAVAQEQMDIITASLGG